MRQKGYPFTERNVMTEQAAAVELQNRGVCGVPAFLIGEEMIVGFSPQQIEQAIDFQIVACPHCGKKLSVPKDKGKLRITCPACQTVFEK